MAFQLNQQLVKDAMARATNELPPLPNVLVKVLELTETTDSGTVGEIEQLIKTDQAISSRLLRIVNSAYFGLSGQVASVNQAVVILGFQQVRNLVLSVSMMTSFSANGARGKEAQLRLWQSAFATASAAQLMGRRKKLDVKDQELVFVGGLLQNIGSLFMLSTLSRSYISVLDEAVTSGKRLFEVENERLGINHAEVGADLLKKWTLPENLIILIARHEGPFDGEILAPLAIVHAAERIGEFCLTDEEFSIEKLGLDEATQAWLGFEPADYETLIAETKVKVTAAMELAGGMDS